MWAPLEQGKPTEYKCRGLGQLGVQIPLHCGDPGEWESLLKMETLSPSQVPKQSHYHRIRKEP